MANPVEFDDPSPVGTGPFVEVLRFDPTVYELGRNKTYWQPGKPTVDVLRVPLFRSNEEITRALIADRVDWASVFFPDIEKAWVATDAARHQYWYADSGPTVLLYVNTREAPFDQSAVRKALSMVVDRARISRDAMNGYASPADATGLADSQKRWKDVLLAQEASIRRDVVAANRLLDEAGLARGSDSMRVGPGGPLRYTLNVVQGWTDWVAAAEIVRQNLGEAGVAVTVKALDYNAWDEALRRGRFELSLGFGSRGPTPYEFYRGQMDGTLVRKVGERAEVNFHRFADAEATRLLRQIEQTSNADGDVGADGRPPAAVRAERAQHPAVHRAAVGRLQHHANHGVPEPLPALRQRGADRLAPRGIPGSRFAAGAARGQAAVARFSVRGAARVRRAVRLPPQDAYLADERERSPAPGLLQQAAPQPFLGQTLPLHQQPAADPVLVRHSRLPAVRRIKSETERERTTRVKRVPAGRRRRQKVSVRLKRKDRGSSGWVWMSATPSAGSPGRRDA